MALEFAHGIIEWLASSTVGTTYTVSGLAFQPKALRFLKANRSTFFDCELSFGVAASPTNRHAVSLFNDQGAGSATCAVAYRDDCVVLVLTDAGGANPVGRLDLDAILSDGFRLIVDEQLGNGGFISEVEFEVWGGSDIEIAEAFTLTEPAAAGNVEVNLSGAFRPDVAMLFGCKIVGASPASSVTTDDGFFIGLTTGPASAENVVIAGNADDASATMDTDGYCQSGECGAFILEGGGTSVNCRITLASFDADGLTFNFLERATTGRRVIGLAIKGGAWRTGSYTIAGNSAGATTTVSGLPFSPAGGLAIERGAVQSTADTAAVESLMCWGRWNNPTTRGATGVRDEDGTATVETDMVALTSAILVVPGTTGVTLSAFDLDAVLTDGFRVIVDTAGGVANEWQGYLTFGSVPPPWTQPVQGTRHVRAQSDNLWRAALVARHSVFGAYDSAPFEEPSTWIQPVQGVGSLATHGRVFYDRAARALWPVHAFEAGPEPAVEEPWSQPVVGTAQLRRAVDALRLQAIRAMGPAWPAEAVVAEEPSTWIQDVQGIVWLSRGQADLWRVARGAMVPAWPADAVVVEEASTWIQAVQGVLWLSRGHSELWRAALEARVRRPDDTDGPRGDQPDTWIQPVVGTAAVHQAMRDMWTRAMEAQGYSLIAAAPVSPVVGHNNLQPYLVVYMWRRTG